MDEYSNDYGKIPIADIGMTTNITNDQLAELKAKIMFGASKVELGFMGGGLPKGGFQDNVPEHYGEDVRRDIRLLAEENEIELTTHAAPNIAPLSGFDGREGFSEKTRKDSQDEIVRAIDFAADTANGGAVVFHLGEWQRDISEPGGEEFEAYTYHKRYDKRDEIASKGKNQAGDLVYDKKGEAVMVKASQEDVQSFAARDTGKISAAFNKKDDIFMPHIKTDGNGNFERYKEDVWVEDRNDPTKKIRIHEKDDLILLTKATTPFQPDEIEKYNPKSQKGYSEVKRGEVHRFERYTWEDLRKGLSKNGENISDDEVLKLRLDRHFEDQKAKLFGQIAQMKTQWYRAGDDDAAAAKSEDAPYYAQAISDLKKQIATLDEDRGKMASVKEIGMERTSDSIANMGMYAMQKSKNTDRPLYIAPENVFPESYGGHPDELRDIVKQGRKAMVNKLITSKGMDKREAQKMAKDHIKSTFDMAHLNVWRRSFQGSEKEFEDWMLKKIKMLQKEDILGHIHISDNFGYSDEHVDPGQGNVPIKRIMDQLKKSNENYDFVVETGKQGNRAFLAGFTHLGKDIYGLSRPTSSDPWNLVESSYFGKTAPPYFVVGSYAQQMGGEMGQKQFSTWSGIPFE